MPFFAKLKLLGSFYHDLEIRAQILEKEDRIRHWSQIGPTFLFFGSPAYDFDLEYCSSKPKILTKLLSEQIFCFKDYVTFAYY